MSQYWTGICTPPPPAEAERRLVLQAVQEHTKRLCPTAAAAAGAATVTVREVRKAIQRLPPGSAPGPDAIPIAVYRRHADVMSAILAPVVTAIGRTNVVPEDFLLGVVNFFYKKGDHTDPANYRPITLRSPDWGLTTGCGRVCWPRASAPS